MSITRKQAETVLATVNRRYKAYFGPILREDGSVLVAAPSEADRPQLREGEHGWEIVWESGPFEWAYRAASGGIDEETAGTLHHEFGVAKAEAGRRATEEPLKRSAKVFLEPVTSYSLGVYEA